MGALGDGLSQWRNRLPPQRRGWPVFCLGNTGERKGRIHEKRPAGNVVRPEQGRPSSLARLAIAYGPGTRIREEACEKRMHTLRKPTTIAIGLALALALLLGALAIFGDKPASAGSDPTQAGAASGDNITPTLITGNPDCSSIAGGPYRELKIDGVEGPFDGTYNDGLLTVNISNSTSQYLDWSSNIGVDAVIVKGGPAGDAYVYDPPKEDTSDTDLHPPVDPNNRDYYGISHVSFCYDLELQVSKTANTSLTRTHSWTIDKSADKDKQTLPVDGTSPVKYDVKV